MRKTICVGPAFFAFILVAGLSAAPAWAADNQTVINIVKNDDGDPVFDHEHETVTITKGQEIKWVPQTGAIPHMLLPDDPAKDAFKPVLPDPNDPANGKKFTSTTQPVQKFETAGTIHYHCFFHGTMKGTITVKDAAAPTP
jgi:plastocyanin